ncbi:HAD family phosphatase [Pseudorhodobacter turbinis]|uniref:HAD family phosphatase n=1 Tax=Pseudorhodobacter turbinis TaxID=2500533 RepID=UPI00143DD43D|nr:HAD family phosphatase [Pseudorhodobacter turbinis]
MKGFDLVIFDCDGVLIESEAQGAQALAEAVTAAGRAMKAHEAGHLFCGCSHDQTGDLIAQMGLDAETVLRDAVQRLSLLFAQGVQQMPGMQELLTGLDTRICVASNSSVKRFGSQSVHHSGEDAHVTPPLPTVVEMEWVPPSQDGIVMCQSGVVQRHAKRRTAR